MGISQEDYNKLLQKVQKGKKGLSVVPENIKVSVIKKNTGCKYKNHIFSILISLFGEDGVYKEYRFSETRRYRADFAIPILKILVEYEGLISAKSRHTTRTGYTNDCTKYNEAQKLGWRVFRYTALNYENVLTDLRFLI